MHKQILTFSTSLDCEIKYLSCVFINDICIILFGKLQIFNEIKIRKYEKICVLTTLNFGLPGDLQPKQIVKHEGADTVVTHWQFSRWWFNSVFDHPGLDFP